MPNETTICTFRQLLEAHELRKQLFPMLGEYLTRQGLHVSRDTIVDMTIIRAPSGHREPSLKKPRYLAEGKDSD